MKYFLEVCLTILILASTTPLVAGQSPAIPMQRGISVQMVVTSTAVTVPGADKEDAVVVTVTHDGHMYLGTDPVSPADLVEKVRANLSTHRKKVIYIKADARTSYANVVMVLDALHTVDVEGFTLLTEQRDGAVAGTLVSPKGLEMLVVPVHGTR